MSPFKKLLQNVVLNASRPSPTRLSGTPDYKEKEVNLDVAYLEHQFYDIQKSKCYWLEVELNPSWIFESGHPLAMSVDRLGYDYVKEGIVICSRFANLGRNTYPDDKFRDVLHYIKSQWGWDEYLLNPPIQKGLFQHEKD